MSRWRRSEAICPEMVLAPTEYFARQCAVSFEVDEHTLPALVPFVGAERIVWGSDYPHHDATFPGAVDDPRHRRAVPDRDAGAVLGLNARSLYGLPPRRSGPAGLVDDYFAAVTAHDSVLLARLFAPDAVLDVDGEQRVGLDAVLGYYAEHTFTYEDFRPSPRELQMAGTTVTVEIDVQLGGADSSVRDVFETKGDRICSLRVHGFDAALRAAESSSSQRSSSKR